MSVMDEDERDEYKENFVPLWYDASKRGYLIQIFMLSFVLGVGYLLLNRAATSLQEQNIASGFGFLMQEASFEIGESLTPFSAEQPFWQAFLAGLLNTLLVALLGNFLAVIWGTLVGITRLSQNWLLAKMAQVYVDTLRNIPLLLQLFFWYALITEFLPAIREALNPLPHTYLSQRGLAFPIPAWTAVHSYSMLALLLGAVIIVFVYRWQKKRQNKTGQLFPFYRTALALLVLPPLLVWLVGGAPTAINTPVLEGFNFNGGLTLSPEFSALLLGLVLYTGAFIAEIVRAGIESVKKGQKEAATSLGLSPVQVLRLVVLPQATRVIIPPLTSQMLNLTKNSSLAVAIGYPDLVSVANTSMNQTGQAIECITILVVVYLTFSLLTSALMNWYNHLTRLVER